MTRTSIELQGPQELIIEKTIDLGLYKTKSEVVRAAINQLGVEYKIFKNIQELEDELTKQITPVHQHENEPRIRKKIKLFVYVVLDNIVGCILKTVLFIKNLNIYDKIVKLVETNKAEIDKIVKESETQNDLSQLHSHHKKHKHNNPNKLYEQQPNEDDTNLEHHEHKSKKHEHKPEQKEEIILEIQEDEITQEDEPEIQDEETISKDETKKQEYELEQEDDSIQENQEDEITQEDESKIQDEEIPIKKEKNSND